ncbi:hypothetical protein BGW36DRAFT_386495 [Talaromyces proteolyticus]|uniref:HNH nuclease domain-containing protein n=1 Tax=Talaromyces proteolyticus TaxID=1131652 RepID=A0AAD4PWC5_9EURO|nr:uncharacterized protein BGW36DRAFT_386495 [Talaromyces proteolyticus]KAH8691857.1 hypothetical protein BGW36DRAFT_386495 [Talaromyces proteolyticus]
MTLYDENILLQRAPYGDPITHIPTSLKFDPNYDIYFRHPAYPDPHDILIILPGLDHPHGGIHHQLALDACAILANNRYEGWFTEDREGNERVNVPLSGILRKRNYYFRVSDHYQDLYPIVPSFEDWIFPHNNVPSSWKLDIPRAPNHPTPRESTLMEATLSRDIRCRITNHIEGTECAHLIPRSQSVWFQRNLMVRYGKTSRPGSEPIDTPRNVLLLRSDIHTSFDYKRFTFVPKPQYATSGDNLEVGSESDAYVTHVFRSSDPHELTSLYHGVKLQILTGVASEYLFARFAWTIFQFIPIFIQAGVHRRVAVYEPANSLSSSVASTEPSVKTLSGDECRFLPLRNKPRSSSPKKRKPEEDIGDADLDYRRGRCRTRRDEDASAMGSFDSGLTADGPWYQSSASEATEDTDLSDPDLDKSGLNSHTSYIDDQLLI